MRALLLILLVTFSSASFAHRHHHHCGYNHHHYGYGYTNFFFVPGNVYERDVYRTACGSCVVRKDYPRVYYWPYRDRVHYYYNAPRGYYYRYWW